MRISYRMISIVLFLLLTCSKFIIAQTSPQPTKTLDKNKVVFDSTKDEYHFYAGNEVQYKYMISDGGLTNSGATFFGLQARAANGKYFRPSIMGGISVKFGGEDKPEINPWDSGITFKRLKVQLNADTVISSWRIKYVNNSVKDSLDYTYQFYISGKTLVIQIQVDSGSPFYTGIVFDRCENAGNARIVSVPYLPLFNLLYSDGGYTSMFVDWEKTNASVLEPFPTDSTVVRYSDSSVRFAHKIIYNPKTNGKRNSLKEVIYLTVSPHVEDVLPNLCGPVAPMKMKSAEKIVLSYGPPYPWLLYPDPGPGGNGYSYKFLDSLKNRGVNDLNVIIKSYQYYGFDYKLPDVLKGVSPNPYKTYKYLNCKDANAGGKGGINTLKNLRKQMVEVLGYGFAFHEQYVDYYPNSLTYKKLYGETYEAKLPGKNSGPVLNWENCDPPRAHVFKASVAQSMAKRWSSSSRLGYYHPTWSYLDVHSAINPSKVVDYESSQPGAGLFRYVVQQYRQIPGILRKNYGGPVQGEGDFHFLYVGYFDDFEARLYTANANLYGWKAPLFVDFDLLKMHEKSVQHGVGHYHSFFAPKPYSNRAASLNRDETLMNIATELAYGHVGLVTKSNVIDHSIEQAVIENKYALPVQKDYANARVVSILYGNELIDATEYIKKYPHFDDINNADEFMSKVQVTYDNGVIVCVNRNPKYKWEIKNLGFKGGWFSYHALVNGKETLEAGPTEFNSFTLPAENGWVVYDPLRNLTQ